eukprot:CAMPEP_0206396694 /NCGR_PEP_ID=MMETSP0294-20121207/22950_1 /ASSEMBLY_ACC=CAM_ASM_000327 /TAXON_ID=39354 /ORGANISM="Heterosigma akashiwo, Strain CCMP2393" /LENGTH=96 /DNA_ID=CAMNT_0053851499 /DNA_START=225 /DNA_END=513 /DNA_ORIENTATION=-
MEKLFTPAGRPASARRPPPQRPCQPARRSPCFPPPENSPPDALSLRILEVLEMTPLIVCGGEELDEGGAPRVHEERVGEARAVDADQDVRPRRQGH